VDVVFCGTPEFAVASLEALLRAGHRVPLVVTQPDRPSGRGQQIAAPPVKQAAVARSLEVIQPEKIKQNEAFRSRLGGLAPQAIVVVGYGRIIPPWMLDLPPLGNINVHASLLPKYRGAAPIQWAIASGESVTGVTTMRLNQGLDTGDILLQASTAIRASETAVTLSPRLAELGAALLIETLARLEAGTLSPTPQDDAQATLAPVLKKEDGLVDWKQPALTIFNRWRGFQPWPGASTHFRGKLLKLVELRVPHGESTLAPGAVRFADGKMFVGCGDGAELEVVQLQPESKKAVSGAEFGRGARLQPNERLG
jgi:methionyl-tRNA formyltransferase